MLEHLRASLERNAFTTAKLATVGAFLVLATAGIAPAQIIYDTIPNPLPPNMQSLGFEANQTDQFGDHIAFAGTHRTLTKVTIVMSDWAAAADFPTFPGATGPTWTHPITLNLYNVGTPTGNPVLDPPVGTLIASRTVTADIPWRPPADPTCGPGQWRASDGTCNSGIAFPVTFDFSGVTVPNEIIYGVSYNTQDYGPSPIHAPGPYNSLNFALADFPPFVGVNPDPDSAYWNTHTAANYSDLGVNGVGIFRRDTAWAPFSGAITFDTTPVDAYQVSYVSNLAAGDSYINITNAGTVNGFDPAGGICANVYAFDPSEELVACCGCYVTPDGLKSLSAKLDLAANTLTPGVPGSLVIKIIASAPTGGAGMCNPSANLILEPGLRAWATSLHLNTAVGKFEMTENAFHRSPLTTSELSKVTSYCGFIQANGSGFGICKSCALGGQGGEKR